MDQRLRKLCEQLRAMSSDEAAAWLMQTYKIDEPSWGEAIQLLPHRSWKRTDQLALASYYLQRMPYASERPYEAFISFMSIHNFLRALREHLPNASSDRLSLLHYHLSPLLERHAKSESDVAECNKFLADIKRATEAA
jgi:hypothetical protein